MDVLKELNDVSMYIEEHITEDISIDELAKITMQSNDSFSRLFTYMVGMTINEYIRRRRLSLAIEDLQNSNDKIIDIAMKYGWNSSDAFAKAFINQHGTTPTNARNKIGSVKIYPPVSFELNIRGAKEMDFKIIDIDSFEVLGLSKQFDCQAGNRFKQENIMWSVDAEHYPERICNGYDGIWYGIFDNGSYSIARKEADVEYSNLEKITIPSGKYAVFTTEKGGYAGAELPRLHDLIFNSWLPSSNYKIKNEYIIEVYHLATDKLERRKNRYYEMWIPIEETNDMSIKKSKLVIRSANTKSGSARKDAHEFYRALGFDNEKEQIRFLKKIK